MFDRNNPPNHNPVVTRSVAHEVAAADSQDVPVDNPPGARDAKALVAGLKFEG
jgi:hypothetical protein